jgi:hypothetical protein
MALAASLWTSGSISRHLACKNIYTKILSIAFTPEKNHAVQQIMC